MRGRRTRSRRRRTGEANHARRCRASAALARGSSLLTPPLSLGFLPRPPWRRHGCFWSLRLLLLCGRWWGRIARGRRCPLLPLLLQTLHERQVRLRHLGDVLQVPRLAVQLAQGVPRAVQRRARHRGQVHVADGVTRAERLPGVGDDLARAGTLALRDAADAGVRRGRGRGVRGALLEVHQVAGRPRPSPNGQRRRVGGLDGDGLHWSFLQVPDDVADHRRCVRYQVLLRHAASPDLDPDGGARGYAQRGPAHGLFDRRFGV
mmetsp:Transcript_4222/g.11318  ORF Transcript_4222/g.11318 Transcript_4222/m.11318 type:complete len:262 (-) Transcript_4222:572-1357(-)